MKLIAYLRVSSNQQAADGTIAHQRRRIAAWAKTSGHKIVRWCEDEAVSGKLDHTHRPGLACAVDGLELGEGEGVVFTALDRLARELGTQEATLALFWKHGARVFTVDMGEVLVDDPRDPMRTAMRQMMGVFAQLERGVIRARMESGRDAKRAAGGYAGHGSPAFGLRSVEKTLVTADDEAETLARIMELHGQGASLRTIASTLAAEGRPAKRGGVWQPTTLARVISRHADAVTAHR